jgi:hypothetical protein
LLIVRCRDPKGNDQCILAFESGDERFVVIVVDFGNLNAGRYRALALMTGDCGHGVLASSHEGLGHELAGVAASLSIEE